MLKSVEIKNYYFNFYKEVKNNEVFIKFEVLKKYKYNKNIKFKKIYYKIIDIIKIEDFNFYKNNFYKYKYYKYCILNFLDNVNKYKNIKFKDFLIYFNYIKKC